MSVMDERTATTLLDKAPDQEGDCCNNDTRGKDEGRDAVSFRLYCEEGKTNDEENDERDEVVGLHVCPLYHRVKK